MKWKIFLIILLFFLNNSAIKAQISYDEICNIYSLIIEELKTEFAKYNQKKLLIANKVIIIDDFVSYYNVVNPIFNNEIEKKNIDYQKFINRTNFDRLNCQYIDIKFISESDYNKKYQKYSKKSIGICFLSNIGYYDNFATVKVTVNLSYGRIYNNFYFFSKQENWNLIYSSIEND